MSTRALSLNFNRIGKRQSGFTLIEIMFVLVTLAILLALALPVYTDQIRKARRADGISSLMTGAHALERCFTRFNAYDDAGCPDLDDTASDDGFYTITVTRDASSFTLTATPTGAQSGDDCGAYTLDHLGNRTPAADSKRCWGNS